MLRDIYIVSICANVTKRSSLYSATIHLRIHTSFDNKDALLAVFNGVGSID